MTTSTSMSVGDRLTQRYVYALSLVALLVMVSQIVIQVSLNAFSGDSHVVNIAGRQRMLSQKISKEAFAIYFATDVEQRQKYIQEMQETLLLWETSHLALQQGSVVLDLPGKNSKRMFADIQPHYQAIHVAAHNLLLAEQEDDISRFMTMIHAHEAEFLADMNAIVFQYDQEALSNVNRLRAVETLILILVLVVLALEAHYIFRPAVVTVNETIQKLENEILRRQQVEEALQDTLSLVQKSRRLLRRIIDATPDWIYVLDKLGRFVMINHSFANTLKHHQAQVVGKRFVEFTVHQSLKPPSQAEMGEIVLPQETFHEPEHHIFSEEGRRSIHDTYNIPLLDEGGQPYALLCISRDITEQKQNEAELIQNRYHLEDIITDRTWRLEIAAILAERLSGLFEVERLFAECVNQLNESFNYYHTHIYLLDDRREMLVLVHGTGESGAMMKRMGHHIPLTTSSLVAKAVRSKQVVRVDNVYDAEDWLPNPLLPSTKSEIAVPLILEDNVIGVLDVQEDETDVFNDSDADLLRLLASQISVAINNARLYEDLAKLNADKDRLFAIIGHDLKGPFQLVLGSVELLMELSDEIALPTEAADMTETIYHSAKQALDLLENLLLWARLQMERVVFQPEPLNFATAIETELSLLQSFAEAKQIRLQSMVTDNIIVYADKNMLQTIIRNLVYNALKFTPSGGQVAISVLLNGEFAEIAVSDTGIGMSEDVQAKLFQIGVHHSTMGTANEQGIGLGLMMCQEMVQHNGGRIWVESEEGRGSTFRFTVPISRRG